MMKALVSGNKACRRPRADRLRVSRVLLPDFQVFDVGLIDLLERNVAPSSIVFGPHRPIGRIPVLREFEYLFGGSGHWSPFRPSSCDRTMESARSPCEMRR
jgi:hypothetical protein